MSAEQDFPPTELRGILHEVTDLLRSRDETISVVESAAGGLISSSLLSCSGASKYYQGGLTLYTLPSRVAYAGRTEEDIADYKGPTTNVVKDLATHTRGQLKGTYTIAESGMAGPTGKGDAPNRTPGYVALAVVCERGAFVKDLNTGRGTDRVGNMKAFAVEALKLLKAVIVEEARL